MSRPLLFFFCFIFSGSGISKTTPLSEAIQAHLVEQVHKHQFQGTVLIAHNGEVVFESAYGMADSDKNKPNTPKTQYLIGSLTKSFTATAIMRLVERGKVDLHVPVQTYIPELSPQLAKGLTPHLLLKHQSGLERHLERLTRFEDKDVSSREILDIINQSKRSFAPGSDYEYGNLSYHLLAMIIENVTVTSYVKAMQDLVFTPLGMHNTGVERLSHLPVDRANGYRKSLFGISRDENIVSYALGSGDIYSTVHDLLLWDQALYRIDFLSEKSLNLLFSPASGSRGNYGYGFRIQPYQRQGKETGRLTRHGGSMDGFLANLHRYTDDNLTVIILANIRSFPIRDMTFELKEIVLGYQPGQRSRHIME